MKRTYRQMNDGRLVETTPIRATRTTPSHNRQGDRVFKLQDDGKAERHERKLAISDSIERCESSGFNRRILQDG